MVRNDACSPKGALELINTEATDEMDVPPVRGFLLALLLKTDF